MSPSLLATRLAALGVVAASAALAGCASGYATSYRAAEGLGTQVAAPRAGPAAEPVVERAAAAADRQDMLASYEKRGYTLIGSSAFDSDRKVSDADAIAQGRKVGADLVLILNPSAAAAAARTVQLSAPASYRNSPATAFGDHPAGQVPSQVTQGRSDIGDVTGTRAVPQSHFAAAYFVKRR